MNLKKTKLNPILRARFNCAALLIGGITLAASADSYTLLPGIPNGISPDRSLIVGNRLGHDYENVVQFSSFVYTPENGQYVWETEYKENDLLKSGVYQAVTNSGIKVGAIKNGNLRLPEEGGGGDFRPGVKRAASATEKGAATTAAAVWRDGKVYVLDCGRWSSGAEFEDSLDGSWATGVTEDGAIVVGFVRTSWFIVAPVYWYWSEENKDYVFGEFPLGENCPVGQPNAFAPSSAVLAGQVSYLADDGPIVCANIWTGPNATEMLTLPQTGNSPYYSTTATAVSEDGRYVGVSGRGSVDYAGIYDRNSLHYTRIPVPTESTDASVVAITNDGSAFVRYRISGGWNIDYYDLNSNTFVSLKYYLSDVAPSIANKVSSSSEITGISGDGKMIIGKNGESGWVIEIDDPHMLTVAPPSKIEFYNTDPTSVILEWEGVSVVPEGCILKGYRAVIDNEERFFEATTTGGSFSWPVSDTTHGGHLAYIQSVFDKDNSEFNSARSTTLTTYASLETAPEMFEDFDDALAMGEMNFSLNNDYWTIDATGEGINEVIRWHLSLEDFDNRSLMMQMYGVASNPWNCRLTSRFFANPATDDLMNISLRYKRRAVSMADQDFSNEYLDIELTEDGKTWNTIHRIKGSDVKEGSWNTLFFETPRPKSPFYRLRINAKGSGTTHLLWMVDDISVNKKVSNESATGLRVIRQDSKEGLTLGWHNELGIHQLSYLENSPIVWDYNVGNEGKPMIVAVDFNKNMTAPFNGEYIQGIASFLYDDPDIAGLNATHAEGILYEDGVEVARAQINSEFQDVTSSVAWFDTPVKIKEGKTYRAGVRISEYPAEQAPIYYQAGLSRIDNVTDLYSEDEGKTWKGAGKMLDNGTSQGYVIWPIRVLITPDAEKDGDVADEFIGWVNYHVLYRNGEPIDNVNYFEPYSQAVDSNPLDEADYQLRTYFTDGSVSDLSEPLHVKFTDVQEIFENIDATFVYDHSTGLITASQNVKSIILTSIDGSVVNKVNDRVLNTVGEKGAYILTLSTEQGNKSFKIIL